MENLESNMQEEKKILKMKLMQIGEVERQRRKYGWRSVLIFHFGLSLHFSSFANCQECWLQLICSCANSLSHLI